MIQDWIEPMSLALGVSSHTIQKERKEAVLSF